MSYLVSVDVLPDRRRRTKRYENELIESGQAAYCEECGEIFEDVSIEGTYSKNVICAECGENEFEAIIKTIRRLALENAANSDEKQRVAVALSFLSDYSEEFQQRLREGF